MQKAEHLLYYVDYLNKNKGFKPDRKYFYQYEEAITWMKRTFDKYSTDMVHCI